MPHMLLIALLYTDIKTTTYTTHFTEKQILHPDYIIFPDKNTTVIIKKKNDSGMNHSSYFMKKAI